MPTPIRPCMLVTTRAWMMISIVAVPLLMANACSDDAPDAALAERVLPLTGADAGTELDCSDGFEPNDDQPLATLLTPAAPGCTVPEVQACVCDIDPYCCFSGFDQNCAVLAETRCAARCSP